MRLNVGGEKFTTTWSTLQQQPGSMLSTMLSASELQPSHLDAEGNFFIDRDGGLFSFVLSYLRNPRSSRLPSNLEQLRELQVEAHFYGLTELDKRAADAILAEERRTAAERKRQRTLHFELSAWGVPSKCSRRCSCWQLSATTESHDGEDYWIMHDYLEESLPGGLHFRQTPNLVCDLVWDPNEEGDKRQLVSNIENKLAASLSPPIKEDCDPRLFLDRFLEDVDSTVAVKERTYGAFLYYPGYASSFGWGADDDLVSEKRHFAMWIRLTLRRKEGLVSEP